MASTTTQILFNPAALHSLKREQLVKLCKIHGIKANGKNVDLIERLGQRAQEMEVNPEREEATRDESEDTDQETDGSSPMKPPTRPSEQWEVVMENIEEVEEPSPGKATLSSVRSMRTQGSAGEFGTNNSKSSVTNSLKALANSLGLKRTLSKTDSNSDFEKYTAPYEPPPPPEPPTDAVMSDANASMEAPIPGGPSRPGAPVPPNARLSTGEGMTTTIRLISSAGAQSLPSPPHLQPYQTDFDLVMSPDVNKMGHKINVWPPASPQTEQRLYPSLDQLMAETMSSPGPPPPSSAKRTPFAAPSEQPDDIFSPSKPTTSEITITTATTAEIPPAALPVPQSQPFLFGSPLPASRPRVSNADFEKAAASVLEEMNKRLAESGVQGVDANLLTGKPTATTAGDIFGAGRSSGVGTATDRFAKAHEDAFAKMDSIASHYAARRGTTSTGAGTTALESRKRKSDALGSRSALGAKRKSSVANTRVSHGTKKKVGLPGGFGDEDDDEDDGVQEDLGDRRLSKRIRVGDSQDVHKGKRVSLLVPITGEDEDQDKEDKKRDAMKRKLDEARARRRSSRGRASIGRTPVKPKASRFGFLASAKSLVRNVWNMGAGGSSNASKPPPNVPAPKPSVPPPPKGNNNATTATATSSNNNHPTPQPPPGKPTSKLSSLGLGRPSTIVKPGSHPSATTNASTSTSNKPSLGVSDRKTSSSHARSPIPSFTSPSQPIKPTTGTFGGSSNNRTSSAPETTTGTRIPSRTGASLAMGEAVGIAPTPRATKTTSVPSSAIGAKRSLVPNDATAGTGIVSPSATKIPSLARPKFSSTLLAPTASSLAKQHSTRPPNSTGQIPSTSNIVRSPMTLQPITNSPQPQHPFGAHVATPTTNRNKKIFTTSLVGLGSPTTVPTPVQKPSFTAVGETLLQSQTQARAGSPTPIDGMTSPTTANGGGTTTMTKSPTPKPTTLVGRKPRISRSRVIAKLGAQRIASGSAGGGGPGSFGSGSVVPSGSGGITTATATTSVNKPPGSPSKPRARSSIGASRKSFVTGKPTMGTPRAGGGKGGVGGRNSDFLMSAKKRVRQSEIAARRRSRFVGAGGGGGLGESRMDVDG